MRTLVYSIYMMTQATNSSEPLCVLRLSETGYSTLVLLVNSSYVAKGEIYKDRV